MHHPTGSGDRASQRVGGATRVRGDAPREALSGARRGEAARSGARLVTSHSGVAGSSGARGLGGPGSRALQARGNLVGVGRHGSFGLLPPSRAESV